MESHGQVIDPSARVHVCADLEPDVSVGPRTGIRQACGARYDIDVDRRVARSTEAPA